MISKALRTISNESGQLTLEFIFAGVLILGVSALLGALTIALTLTEVAQYISYSGARAYFSGNLTEADQADFATGKVADLIKTMPFLAGAKQNNWIVIAVNGPGNYSAYGEAIGSGASLSRNTFIGFQLDLTFPILGLKLPLLGPAVTAPEGGSFTAKVSSFLMREPSTAECIRFSQKSYAELLKRGSYQAASAGQQSFTPVLDNGC